MIRDCDDSIEEISENFTFHMANIEDVLIRINEKVDRIKEKFNATKKQEEDKVAEMSYLSIDPIW